MTDLNEPGHPEPPVAGDETTTLVGSLERQRAIFAWKCGGLDAAGLQAKVGASSVTLGGLLKHLALVEEAVARSRSSVAEALADGGLDRLARSTWPDGRAPSLRRILIDLIEEYARHVGHADLIRESVDGLVGEDPPG